MFVSGGTCAVNMVETFEAKDAKLRMEWGIPDAIPKLCLFSVVLARCPWCVEY
jgi:hypothetical protein